MTDQQLPQALPDEGFSIARQVMEDVIVRFLPNGGPAAVRTELNKVAEVLIKVYDDGKEAYDAALEKVRQIEIAQQQAEENKWQEIKVMMSAIMNVIPKNKQDKQPSDHAYGQGVSVLAMLPPKFSTPKAILMWERLQQEGIIDENYQPIDLSLTDMALLAEEINMVVSDENERLLGFMEWKPYETLWHKNNLKTDLYRSKQQDKTSDFCDKLKNLFEGL